MHRKRGQNIVDIEEHYFLVPLRKQIQHLRTILPLPLVTWMKVQQILDIGIDFQEWVTPFQERTKKNMKENNKEKAQKYLPCNFPYMTLTKLETLLLLKMTPC